MTGDRAPSAMTMPPGLEQSGPIFDRATRLARSMFGGVDAQVTLMSKRGLWRSRPGGEGIGGEAIGVQEVMRLGQAIWVEDCLADDRFRDAPTVATPPYVRFFAGAPIRLEDGSTPGALWVAGLEPRAHDRTLAARLQDVADFVADEWARVKARRASAGYERTMGAIINAMPVSMVLTDRDVRLLYASPPWIEARGLKETRRSSARPCSSCGPTCSRSGATRSSTVCRTGPARWSASRSPRRMVGPPG